MKEKNEGLFEWNSNKLREKVDCKKEVENVKGSEVMKKKVEMVKII